MPAEPSSPTPTEALQGLLADCQARLAKGGDWQRVVAYLVINLNPIADLIATDEAAMPTQRAQ